MSDGAGARKNPGPGDRGLHSRANDEVRTRDLNLGKVALYQLSYVRIASDRLSPIGASTILPDPQGTGTGGAERVTGIAHCAFLLEGGCSTTELHPHVLRELGLSASPLGVLQTLADQVGCNASRLSRGAGDPASTGSYCASANAS